MILSLEGEGVLIRDSKEIKLKLPQRFLSNDELAVKKGKAVIMLFSGEEINLAAVSKYTIPVEENTTSSEVSEMANGDKSGKSLLSQSGVAYRLRGESKVFPTASKVLDSKNVQLKIGYDNIEDLNLSLKVVNSQTQKVIYQTETISDSLLSLSEAPFKAGKTYHWILSHTPNGKPEMGTIIVSKDEVIQDFLSVANPQTHYQFMNAISAYYNGRYYFEALYTINRAIEQYPDYKIYQVLLENLLAE